MKIMEFIKNNILVLDGATGTELIKNGMPSGICPEEWILNNPQILIDIQNNYVSSGSRAVYAPTFGANRIKLKKSSLKESIYDINIKLLNLTKQAVQDKAFIGGDLSPVGELLYPLGELTEMELIDIYKEQVKAFSDFGVDFIVVETMMDIREVKCAILAIKDICDIPIFISMTLEKNGKTLTGTDPLTAMLLSKSYGADVFGLNCSTGPDNMLSIIEKIYPYSKDLPLLVKPNAGMPHTENNITVFDMNSDDFAYNIKKLVDLGVNIIGGCCGTNAQYINKISDISLPSEKKELLNEFKYVCSSRYTVFLDDKTEISEMILDNNIDVEDMFYDILDCESEAIKIIVNCDDKKLIEFLEKINMTVFTPIIFETINEKQRELIKRIATISI